MATPRKFQEKIALHQQRQAEETASFDTIMAEVQEVTRKVISPGSKEMQQGTRQEIDDILAEFDSEDEEEFRWGFASDEEVFPEDGEVHEDDLNFKKESEKEIETILGGPSWQCVGSDKSASPERVGGAGSYHDIHRVVGLKSYTPFQCFQKLFPDEIYEYVANETNKYAKYMIEKKKPLPPESRFCSWTDVSVCEIKAFIAIEIAMGLVRKSSLRSYFAKRCLLTETPGFGYVLSRARYELIHSCLHFVDNEEEAKGDRLYKIRPILNAVKSLYTEVYVSNKEVCVNEMMLKFKERLFQKQNMPETPSKKWGVKLWALCDAATGYLLKFEVYTGKAKDLNTNVGAREHIVMKLLEEFENKGHVVYMDDFFSGVQLFQELMTRKTGACGMVCPDRKGLPSEMKEIKIEKGDAPTFWRSDDESTIACSWQGSRRVNLLSTIGDSSTVQISVRSKKGSRIVDKPVLLKSYDKFMGGVERFDRLCANYPFDRRSKKWYRSIWHFVIEVALVNSRICYNIQNKKKIGKVLFRQKVISGLLEGFKRNRLKITPSRLLTQGHYITQYRDRRYRPHCKVCSFFPNQCVKKGRGACKRRQTSFFCKQCPEKPPLCVIPCFEDFHRNKDYRKSCRCKW